jgi:hypothetical protein
MSITLTARLDVETIERNGKHFVVIKMDGVQVDRRGPFPDAQTAATASERLIKKFTPKPAKIAVNNDTHITLRGVAIELSSDAGRHFALQACRAAEGQIGDQDLMDEFELTAEELKALAENKALGKEIRRLRELRVRSLSATRELAAKAVVKGPAILESVMVSEHSGDRAKIESIKTLYQIAAPENQSTPEQSERFHIVLNLGADTEIYSKSIAINPNDEPPTAPEQPKLTIIPDETNDER